MLKKIFALMAVVGLFAISNLTAVANNGAPYHIGDLSVDPMTFNPSEGEEAVISLTLLQDADIYVFAVDSDENVFRIHGSSLFPAEEEAGELSIVWAGLNMLDEPLADGLYNVGVRVYDEEDEIVDSGFVRNVEITSTPDEEPVAPVFSHLYADPFIFHPEDGEKTAISFSVDIDSYVTALIKEEDDVVRTFSQYEDRSVNGGSTYTFFWDGTDDGGWIVSPGLYTVEVTAEVDGLETVETVGVIVEEKEDPTALCGGYWDTQNLDDYLLCKSIEWVTEEGIFQGYADGSFGHKKNINRAETLKVIFEAFKDVSILPGDGHDHGFSDVEVDEWYMPYVRTAKFYGMLHGYPDGTMRPGSHINRVEFLKLALEASEAFTWYTIPTFHYSYYIDVDERDNPWFLDYAGISHRYELFDYDTKYTGGPRYLNPADLVTRGEVAKLLYRMHLYGLLG